jgi:tRNA-dihydrouridine synthase
MLAETHCNGVMIGRGALGNPWIFCAARKAIQGLEFALPSLEERERVICRHLERNVNLFGEREGVKDFYRHLAWYTKGMRGCGSLRKQVLGLGNYEAIREAIHRFFNQAISSWGD